MCSLTCEYIKATGQGLSQPLHSFQVTIEPEQRAKLRITTRADEQLSGWSLRHLDPAPGYGGALAAPLVSFPLVQWTFETPRSVSNVRFELTTFGPESRRLLLTR